MPEAPGRGRLLLARHGRTRWNVEERRLGRTDIPLDEAGQAQADTLRDLLAGVRIDAVYASPLRRAIDTAAPLTAARALPTRIDHDLIEFDYGDYGGTVRQAVRLKLRRDHLYKAVPGGESLAEAWTRAQRAVERLAVPLRDGAHLLVVGHQRLNRLMVGVLESRTLEETVLDKTYRPLNGAVLDLWLDDTLRIVERRELGGSPMAQAAGGAD